MEPVKFNRTNYNAAQCDFYYKTFSFVFLLQLGNSLVAEYIEIHKCCGLTVI